MTILIEPIGSIARPLKLIEALAVGGEVFDPEIEMRHEILDPR